MHSRSLHTNVICIFNRAFNFVLVYFAFSKIYIVYARATVQLQYNCRRLRFAHTRTVHCTYNIYFRMIARSTKAIKKDCSHAPNNRFGGRWRNPGSPRFVHKNREGEKTLSRKKITCRVKFVLIAYKCYLISMSILLFFSKFMWELDIFPPNMIYFKTKLQFSIKISKNISY